MALVVSGESSVADDLSPALSADIIIKIVLKIATPKKPVFRDIDHWAPPSKILAANTTSLSISNMPAATNQPGQVVQIYFFKLPTIMKLVEIM